MMNCLKGCVNTYKQANKNVRRSIDKAVLLPWVELLIAGSGVNIAVSNFSSRTSRAIIKSFQFGVSNGLGAEFEIVDEEGGNFANFILKISRGNKEAVNKSFALTFRFGWAGANWELKDNKPFYNERTYGTEICCPSSGQPHILQMSCRHRLYVAEINATVSEGVYKFKVVCLDMSREIYSTRDVLVFGGDSINPTGNTPVYLKEAIKEMFRPYKIAVDFRKKTTACSKGDPLLFDSKGTGEEENGPKGVWQQKGLNPIDAALTWLKECLSKDSKGITYYWTTIIEKGAEKPELVFLEDTNKAGTDPVLDSFRLGTYIVNGGKCSPVISFDPEIKFLWTQQYTRTFTSGQSGPQIEVPGPQPDVNSGGVAQNQGQYRNQPESSQKGVANNQEKPIQDILRQQAHDAVNAFHQPYTATMRIQGDPSYDSPLAIIGNIVSVVVINPFRVTGTQSGCNWSYLSGCQEQLSSNDWRLMGVSHEISEGSFTTTLQLKLFIPGFNKKEG